MSACPRLHPSIALLVLLAALTACSADDLAGPGARWHPTGANDINLAAMVADPLDLVNGAVTRGADGAVAANAVARYRAGKIKPLPDSGISKITTVSSGSGGQAPALEE